MWKASIQLLRPAAGRRITATAATPSFHVTPYRLYCAVHRADPLLQKKSPAGRVAVLINRFKRLSPQARGGLLRVARTVQSVPSRKRLEKFRQVVATRRRVAGFTSNLKSANRSKPAPSRRARSLSLPAAKKQRSKGTSAAVTAKAATRRSANDRLRRLKGRATRVAAKLEEKKKKKGHAPPPASAPYAAHLSHLLYRIRTNSVGPRDAAKMINELRRKHNRA